MDLKYAKIESWHAVQHESDAGHSTFCGLVAQGEVVDTLPAGKSCESCSRIVLRLLDGLVELEEDEELHQLAVAARKRLEGKDWRKESTPL